VVCKAKLLPKLDTSLPVKASVQKVQGHVVYRYLLTPPVATRGAVDYCRVVFSLCDVLSLIYSRFLDPTCAAFHDAILKIDRKVKQLVIGKVARELTALAKGLINTDFSSLLNHTFLEEQQSPLRPDARSGAGLQ
jgi:hypothetical protein